MDKFKFKTLDPGHTCQLALIVLQSDVTLEDEARYYFDSSDIDAVFMACINMKCAQVIPRIERETGVAALSSNQVLLAWHMIDQAKIKAPPATKGRLFTCTAN